jgi:hypothetical protein
VGTVLGVAGLVAILSRVSSADPVTAYRHGVILIIAFFVAAGAVSAGLLTGPPVVAAGSATPVPTLDAAASGAASEPGAASVAVPVVAPARDR